MSHPFPSKLALLSILLVIPTTTQGATGKLFHSKLCERYNAGDAVAIVGNSKPDESEWYADWSAYLNDFAMANAEMMTTYHSSNHAEFNVPDYTVFFAKKGHPSFSVSEAVEPQYYEYVAMAYAGEAIPPSISTFKAEKLTTDEIAVYCGQ